MRILNDILDFSKIEAGKLELEYVPFSLRECVGKTMQTLAIRSGQKRLELACRIAPDVPDEVEGDPGRLRQVIVNLVGNAIKFTDVGEVVLDIELHDGDSTKIRHHTFDADSKPSSTNLSLRCSLKCEIRGLAFLPHSSKRSSTRSRRPIHPPRASMEVRVLV